LSAALANGTELSGRTSTRSTHSIGADLGEFRTLAVDVAVGSSEATSIDTELAQTTSGIVQASGSTIAASSTTSTRADGRASRTLARASSGRRASTDLGRGEGHQTEEDNEDSDELHGFWV